MPRIRSAILTIAAYSCDNLVCEPARGGRSAGRRATRGRARLWSLPRKPGFGRSRRRHHHAAWSHPHSPRPDGDCSARFDDAQFDELQFERRLSSESGAAPIAACWYWIRKLQARFFAGDYVAAVDASMHMRNDCSGRRRLFLKRRKPFLRRAQPCGVLRCRGPRSNTSSMSKP